MAKSTQHHLAGHTAGRGNDSTVFVPGPAALPTQGMSATEQHPYCMPKGFLGQVFLIHSSLLGALELYVLFNLKSRSAGSKAGIMSWAGTAEFKPLLADLH